MSYYQVSGNESGRRRSWSDVTDLVNEEVGKKSDSCQGCILLFLATTIIISTYSVLSFLHPL